MIRFARFNRELVLFERWRIPYAPNYGWRHLAAELRQVRVTTSPEGDYRKLRAAVWTYLKALSVAPGTPVSQAALDRMAALVGWPTVTYVVGDRVIIASLDALYEGREGTVTVVHPTHPAADIQGCPILDVKLESGEERVFPASAVRRSAPRVELAAGDHVIVDFPDATYYGREGTVVAVHPDSPAAEWEGCPILDVVLAGDGEAIILPAKAVSRL